MTPVADKPTTLIVDASALLCRYLPDPRTAVVRKAMAHAGEIVVAELARTEVELGLHQALGASRPGEMPDPTSLLSEDWDRFWVLPIDSRCLRRASDIGRGYGLNLANALHLAAFDRVPRPATLLSLDDRQYIAAGDLGFDIVDITLDEGGAHRLLQSDR